MSTKRITDLPELTATPDDADWLLVEDISTGATSKVAAEKVNPLALRTADALAGAQFRRQDSLGGPQVVFAEMWRSGFFAIGVNAVALGDLTLPGLILIDNGGGLAALKADNVTPVVLFNFDSSDTANFGDTSVPARVKGSSFHVDGPLHNDNIYADESTGCGIGIANKPTVHTGGVRVQTTPTAGNYTTTAGDYYVGVTDTTAPRTITLLSNPPDGTVQIIKDESNGAAINNITVVPGTGQIEHAASYPINTNGGSVGLIARGGNWFLA